MQHDPLTLYAYTVQIFICPGGISISIPFTLNTVLV